MNGVRSSRPRSLGRVPRLGPRLARDLTRLRAVDQVASTSTAARRSRSSASPVAGRRPWDARSCACTSPTKAAFCSTGKISRRAPASSSRLPPASADDLPGPVRVANPRMKVEEVSESRCAPTASGRRPSVADGCRGARARRPPETAGRRSRTPSPAGSASASASPARSCSSPISSCRRAGVGPRRLDPGPDRQPPQGPPGRAGAHAALHRARSGRRPADRRARGGDVPGGDRRARPRDAVFGDPQHPYTQSLLSAVPVPDPELERTRGRIVLAGDVPSPIDPPSGCRFHTRCPYAMDDCRTIEPVLRPTGGGRIVACHLVHPPETTADADGGQTL